MENRYFIQDVYVPSGSRTIEHNLAKVVEPYVDHILSAGAMQRLADMVREEQDTLCAASKRLKPVPVELDLDGGTYSFRFFRIGQVSVQFRHVKGELI